MVEINGDRYYTDIEVCELVGISRVTLYKWLKQKKIEAPDRFTIKRQRIWNNADVEKIMAVVNRTYTRKELS